FKSHPRRHSFLKYRFVLLEALKLQDFSKIDMKHFEGFEEGIGIVILPGVEVIVSYRKLKRFEKY
ncbi:MAG: hypothetical protein N3F06_02850, partial [Nitrososphaerales archaeon]|nr:hypothetical protein [Nitrososphaerales archaeon]